MRTFLNQSTIQNRPALSLSPPRARPEAARVSNGQCCFHSEECEGEAATEVAATEAMRAGCN